MIPAYKEDVKITIVEKDTTSTLEEQVRRLNERVHQLTDTVNYMERERSRLKGEIDTIKHQLNKK